MNITTTWTNDNPDTIYNVMARKLGREPTDAEIRSELKRIGESVLVDMASRGTLPHQRRR